MNDDPLPFALVADLAAREGIDALATLALPERLPEEGLQQMLADGVGDMTWLADQAELRADPRHLLPGASTALVVALPYESAPGPGPLRRARYAAGADYHKVLRGALARVGRGIVDQRPQWQTRACVDSAPLNERWLARKAGLGWHGRNALLIREGRGSYAFLGVLLCTGPLALKAGGQGADRCGRCRACVDRCPTQAIVDGRVLSERCISYLTIEHKGVIPTALAERFEGWWYGCDLCQEVCPWNRFAPGPADGRLAERPGRDEEAALMALSEEDFDHHFAGSPVRRIGWSRFRRNLLCAHFSIGGDLTPFANDPHELVQAQRAELGC